MYPPHPVDKFTRLGGRYYYYPRGPGDLARLARTCKLFKNPALNLLWYEQQTVINLIKCLPSHLWEETILEPNRNLIGSTIRIIGPLQPSDWDVSRSYAHRIRSLILDFYCDEDLVPAAQELFEFLGTEFSQDYLCPNLTAIGFRSSCSRESFIRYVSLFLGPKIVDVQLCLPSEDSHLLIDLPIPFPKLQRLYLSSTDNYRGWPLDSDTLSEIVSSLDQIKYLDIDPLDQASIEYLSQLPALETLTLGVPQHWRPNQSLYYHAILSFPRFWPLTNLEIRTPPEAVTAATAHRLYTSLANHVLHSTLQNLTIGVEPERELEMEPPPEDVMADYIVPGNTLALLFCFRILLTYASKYRSTLLLAEATTLHSPSKLSLNALRAFATHCPELNFIAIAFDASTVPLIHDSFESHGSQSSLTCLDVRKSPIIDLDSVATFLSKLFPNLAKIHTFEDSMWSDLERLYPGRWPQSIDRSEYEQYRQWQWVEHLLKFPEDIRRNIVREDSECEDF
ncbi:hypothetical protein R3P38DRAFT_3183521 [Favolaschia claudopus]|uniref:F-box domain-containing protein n=1 Tax=Favolaschia claudopus TaxID=2862362 RepID=A0AAW0CAY3_9AGAR